MTRSLRRILGALLLAGLSQLAVGGPSITLSADVRRGAPVDDALRRVIDQRPSDAVRVIIQARRASDAEYAIGKSGGHLQSHLPHVAGASAELRADQVATVANAPGIVRVMLDPVMYAVAAPATSGPVSVYPQTVGAAALWASGRTGRGVGVAVLDSGVQPHQDFGTPSRIVFNQRFNAGASSAADQYGHGTWVAGIAAGEGRASGGQYAGIAPQASVVNLKISDDTGAAHASDVLNALGWLARNHAAYNVRVVNLSFVSSVAESYATNLLDAAVEMVWHSGVAVVASAGNRGVDTLRYAPANDPYVITVGATDDVGTVTAADDVLALFSSYGLTQDGFAKPDLVAPGRHIVGPLSSDGAVLAHEFPTKVVGTRYIQLSGTSAAAPIVSGAVALLSQARPELTPDQLKWLLTRTARPIAGARLGVGAGELDVAAAAGFGGALERANLGLAPNRLVGLAYLSQTGQSSVSWDSVSWDSVSWDSVSWDSVRWDSVSWDSVTTDPGTTDTVLGAD